MQLSPATLKTLAMLDEFSGRKLTRKEDLAILLELAGRTDRRMQLEELSFTAKFLSNTHRIMQRIGSDGEGYEKLATEFSANIEKAMAVMRALLSGAPPDVVRSCTARYLMMTHESLQNLLVLCYDLSWYKNWLIDTPDAP